MSVRAAIGSICGNTLRVCNNYCPLQSPLLCDRCLRGWFLSALFEIPFKLAYVGIRPAMRYGKYRQLEIQEVFSLCLNTGLLRRIEAPHIVWSKLDDHCLLLCLDHPYVGKHHHYRFKFEAYVASDAPMFVVRRGILGTLTGTTFTEVGYMSLLIQATSIVFVRPTMCGERPSRRRIPGFSSYWTSGKEEYGLD